MWRTMCGVKNSSGGNVSGSARPHHDSGTECLLQGVESLLGPVLCRQTEAQKRMCVQALS